MKCCAFLSVILSLDKHKWGEWCVQCLFPHRWGCSPHKHTHTRAHTHSLLILLLTFSVTLLLRISFGLRSPFSTFVSLLRGALSFSARLRARSVFHERDFLLCQNIKLSNPNTLVEMQINSEEKQIKVLEGKIISGRKITSFLEVQKKETANSKILSAVNLFLSSSSSIYRCLKKYFDTQVQHSDVLKCAWISVFS